MEGQQIAIEAVKGLIAETVKQVAEAMDKRQDAHETRTEKQVQKMSGAIETMSQTLSENSKAGLKIQTETNKQLAHGNAQFIKWEERHHGQNKQIGDLFDMLRKEAEKTRALEDDQIADRLTRKVTWKVGAIMLTATLGGAFTFAWFLIKTMTSTILTATGG